MNKYIDAEKLIAEIERRKNESRELPQEHKNSSLKTSTTPSPAAMHNDNTITLCSLAEPNLTRYTIENAIGWTAHMEYDQIIKCQDDGKPVLNIKQRQEEFIRRIKESGLHFHVKRIFHVIHPTLSWQHERKFTDSAMRYLKMFVKNDIPFTLVPSEGMTEDLERLQQNSPPLYDVIIEHLSPAGAAEVNLEKEATKFVQSKEFIESKESPVLLTARYFYELGGLNMNWIKLGRNVEIKDTMFPLILRRNDGKLYIWRSKFWFTLWFYLLPVKFFYRKHVFTHMITIKQPKEE